MPAALGRWGLLTWDTGPDPGLVLLLAPPVELEPLTLDREPDLEL